MSKKQVQEMKAILKGYKHFNRKMVVFFEGLGFTVLQTGSHVKLMFENGQSIILAKTPSDYRAGLNAYSMIVRVCGRAAS